MKNGKIVVKILSLACIIQIVLTIYMVIKIYVASVVRPDQIKGEFKNEDYNNNDDIDEDFKFELLEDTHNNEVSDHSMRDVLSHSDSLIEVGVHGDNALASYLWEHILRGTKVADKSNGSLFIGYLATSKCIFKYMEGSSLLPEIIAHNQERIILVLRGQSNKEIEEAKSWLHLLKHAPHHPKVLLVMLGSEKCENEWLQNYILPRGPVVGVFLTYDDTTIDDETYFQWPLGVDMDHFSNLKDQVNVSQSRKYLCNLQLNESFNFSKNGLVKLLKLDHFIASECHIGERNNESPESMILYVNTLLESDLTLCPAGLNTETYCVYEAVSAGSVPVIEDVSSGGECDKAGWRLLKKFSPPFIWIKDWDQLKSILKKEKRFTQERKVRRRQRLLDWNEWFLMKTRNRFLSVVNDKLLKPD